MFISKTPDWILTSSQLPYNIYLKLGELTNLLKVDGRFGGGGFCKPNFGGEENSAGFTNTGLWKSKLPAHQRNTFIRGVNSIIPTVF